MMEWIKATWCIVGCIGLMGPMFYVGQTWPEIFLAALRWPWRAAGRNPRTIPQPGSRAVLPAPPKETVP
jgi:hypothetical protein